MKKNKLTRLVGKWQPWDYGHNLDIERAMFEKQAEYISKSNVSFYNSKRAKIAKLLASLINIIQNKDNKYKVIGNTVHFVKVDNSFYKMEGMYTVEDTVYINKRNASRFLNSFSLKFMEEHPEFGWHDLRVSKAWFLYHKLRFYKMQELWD